MKLTDLWADEPPQDQLTINDELETFDEFMRRTRDEYLADRDTGDEYKEQDAKQGETNGLD